VFLCRLRRTLARIEQRLNRLEIQVTATDDAVTQLNDATNDIATELDELRGQVAGLDQATADKLTPIVERLRGLAADPQNPVPDPGTPAV
jgi:uncharacterized coiled-coil protein SlyX